MNRRRDGVAGMVWEASMVCVDGLSLGIHVVGGLRVGVEPFLQPLVEGQEEQGGQLGFLQEVIRKAGDTIYKGRFVQKMQYGQGHIGRGQIKIAPF
jgi:hypothetical protein